MSGFQSSWRQHARGFRSVTTTRQLHIRFASSKVYQNPIDAVSAVKSGDTLLSGGFGLCGLPNTLIRALSCRQDVNDLTAVSNNAGAGGHAGGLGALLEKHMISKIMMSYIGTHKTLESMFLGGQVDVELVPQGTLAERIRAGGAGIPGFYTPTGVDTPVMLGTVPLGHDRSGKPARFPKAKETREFEGKRYILEEAIKGNVTFIRAWKVDEEGNAIFRYTANNFSTAMAKASQLTIVEAEEIVPTGSLEPSQIHLPGIYVHRIIQATSAPQIEFLTVQEESPPLSSGVRRQSGVRERIAKRAAQELHDGDYVNLGIGIPTLIPSFIPRNRKVWLQSENGILGTGPSPARSKVDADIINAGKETVTLLPGASIFDSTESFAMIRGGHIDVSILGAMEVSSAGDLANWIIPGKLIKGMGGAMDLVSSPDNTKIIVVTEHCDRDGKSKVVPQCSLPLTGSRCASMIITDLGVFEIDRRLGVMTLVELQPGVSLEEITAKTAAPFKTAKELKTVSYDQSG